MYALEQATDPLQIGEQQYGIGEQVKFTTFTSCIGILSKVTNEDKVIGVHLVLVGKKGGKITEDAVMRVMMLLERLKYDRGTTKVLGHIGIWKEKKEGAPDVWQRLKNSLGVDENRTFPWGDGTYGGTLEGGQVEITF